MLRPACYSDATVPPVRLGAHQAAVLVGFSLWWDPESGDGGDDSSLDRMGMGHDRLSDQAL
jgi:hypothetical protein